MKNYTLEEITASWLGHGKQIPIGESMAWLIREVERLYKINQFSESIAGQVSESADFVRGLERTIEIMRVSPTMNVSKYWLCAAIQAEIDKANEK